MSSRGLKVNCKDPAFQLEPLGKDKRVDLGYCIVSKVEAVLDLDGLDPELRRH